MFHVFPEQVKIYGFLFHAPRQNRCCQGFDSGNTESDSRICEEHEEEFIAKVRIESKIQREDAARTLQKKLSREQKRNNELDQLIKKIYEDNVSGKLTDKRFEMLLSDYEQEQTGLETSIQNTQKEISDFEEDNTRIGLFSKSTSSFVKASISPSLHTVQKRISNIT